MSEPATTGGTTRRRARRPANAQFGIGTGEPAVDVSALPTAATAPIPVVVFAPPLDANAELPPARRRRATAAQSRPAQADAGRADAAEPAAEAEFNEDELAPAEASIELSSDDTDAAVLAMDGAVEDAVEDPADEDLLERDVVDATDTSGAEDEPGEAGRRRRRRGRRGRGARSEGSGGSVDVDDPLSVDADTGALDAVDDADSVEDAQGADMEADGDTDTPAGESSTSRRRRRRRSRSSSEDVSEDDPPNTVVHVRPPRGRAGRGAANAAASTATTAADPSDEVRGIRGSSRLEAKRQRRRDGRDNGRRRSSILTEAEFLARRESVERVMAVRQLGDRTQIAILEDDILVEHYVTRASATSYVGNVYLGRVQNVLPSMEAAFVDISKGRNGVLYAGEVNWDAAGLEGKSRAIEAAMKSGDALLVQVTKDPIAHKGARLTSQISLPGRFLVYVPGGGMTGISRKLPDTERSRLKAILKRIVPEDAGVIVRTAAEGATEEDLTRDVERLVGQWQAIVDSAAKKSDAPVLVHGEPDLAIRVVRDVFNEDFTSMVVQGASTWTEISNYVTGVAPELAERISPYVGTGELFADLRVDEQLAKALDRKVWLPSGGSLVIDRTEAMTVIDVNTGKFIGSDGNLESTVTKNNLEAAEEIVRQLRLRDIGGIVVIDFIDMVLESNRDLVLRRLTECLGRDRTKHQVAEVTSLGLVQMTRKRVGEGLLEAFSEPCEHCKGRGVIVHAEPVDQAGSGATDSEEIEQSSGGRRGRNRGGAGKASSGASTSAADGPAVDVYDPQARKAAAAAMNAIARRAQTGEVTVSVDFDDAVALAEIAARDDVGTAAELETAAEFEAAAELETLAALETPSELATVEELEVVAVSGPAAGLELATQLDRELDKAAQTLLGDVAPLEVDRPAEAAAAPHTASEPDAPASAQGSAAIQSAPTSAGPRRRRAASRPAGPPRTVVAN